VVPLSHWQLSVDRDDESLRVTTPKSVRTYRYRASWSAKAAELVSRNVRALSIYLQDPAYQEGLLAQWRLEAARAVVESAEERLAAFRAELAYAQLEIEQGVERAVYGAADAAAVFPLDLPFAIG
jgi:hypothetical protein